MSLFTNPDLLAFMAAIRDKPEDDAPRLIFADWLDENGEPEWAEYIRLALKIYRMDDVNINQETLKELSQRQRELKVIGFARGWSFSFEPTDEFLVHYVTHCRGLIHVANLNVPDWLAVADRLSLHPLQKVSITRFPDREQAQDYRLFPHQYHADHRPSIYTYTVGGCEITHEAIVAWGSPRQMTINLHSFIQATFAITWPHVPFDFTEAIQHAGAQRTGIQQAQVLAVDAPNHSAPV